MLRIFGLIGLVLALVIVGMIASKELRKLPASAQVPTGAASAPATVRAQSQQIQQQFKQQLDSAMQAPRQLPDDAR